MYLAPALALSALTAFSPTLLAQTANSSDDLPESVLATVNGRPIPQIAIDNVSQQLVASGQQADPEQILQELINLEMLTQAAEELELDKTEEISAALQLQYTQTMANAYLARKGADMVFSEAELRAEYDAQTAAVDRSEYLASHILVDTRELAEEIIAELAAGKQYDALAKLHSIDPSGETGGDLGWFQANTMVPEFTSAVAQMEVGDTSQQPVESEFGFHIIKLNDKRNSALPDYDSVKPGLTNLAVRKALAKHVEELRASAEIKTR